MNEELLALSEKIVSTAKEKDILISFAESCTGGLAGAYITAIAGSSDIFLGSAVTYCNQAKHNVLGVGSDVIASFGAVSSECALQMAVRSRLLFGSDIAVSVTGVAGPYSVTQEKPVGTVWFGYSSVLKNGSFLRNFDGDRNGIREASVKEILMFLLGEIS